MTRRPSPYGFLLLVPCVAAYTRFDATCTLPPTSVNYVSSPDMRGSLDILWSCLFTIVACTWTIQHLNIPEQRDRRKEKEGFWYSIWYYLEHTMKNFWRNLKWMLFTMVAPELIFGIAVQQFYSARALKKQIESLKKNGEIEEDEEWELSHGFFLFMGGFRVLEEVEETVDEGVETKHELPNKQAVEAMPNDDAIEAGDKQTEKPLGTHGNNTLELGTNSTLNSEVLTPRILLWLRTEKYIKRLPSISENEIHDKSKSSVLVKSLAAIQVFWVCFEVIVRAARGLPISQLELVVTAFSACAIVTYCFLIPKPQGIQVPMRPVRVPKGVLRKGPDWNPLHDLNLDPSGDSDWYIGALRELIIPGYVREQQGLVERCRKRVPDDYFFYKGDQVGMLLGGFVIGGLIFGSIHVAGWNLELPTLVEQTLWRIASVMITVLLPMQMLGMFILLNIAEWLLQAWGLFFGVLYIVARLYLLVETFRTLAFLPPDAFVSTWVSNIPSVG